MWKRLIWAEDCSFNCSVCWSFIVKSSHQIQDKLQRGREVFLLIVSWTSDSISKALHSWCFGSVRGLFHFLSLSQTHKFPNTFFEKSMALMIKINVIYFVLLSNHSLGSGRWGCYSQTVLAWSTYWLTDWLLADHEEKSVTYPQKQLRSIS